VKILVCPLSKVMSMISSYALERIVSLHTFLIKPFDQMRY